ncbi:MAG TPA: zinc ribbon domain-containing protein [Gemmatimonadales bacterium]|nr:zinc ribbon domain-containing protein [Gemmatimonadales bacterium]
MAIYEYRCTACGHEFERVESISQHASGARVQCPECRSSKVERVFTPFYAKTVRKS